MNHLAHLYLSRRSEKWMVGNFIADAVKGKKYLDYDPEIAEGILIHREIDTFTDSHPVVRHSKSLLRDHYGLYAPVIVDLFYDHFLAWNWSEYSEWSLADFAQQCYNLLLKYTGQMPERYQRILPYMERENWLLNYATEQGIGRALSGMSRRIIGNTGIENAVTELKKFRAEFDADFRKYFPELIVHVEQFISR